MVGVVVVVEEEFRVVIRLRLLVAFRFSSEAMADKSEEEIGRNA